MDMRRAIDRGLQMMDTNSQVVKVACASRLGVCALMTVADLLLPDHSPDPSVARFVGFPSWATRWDSARFLNLALGDGYTEPEHFAFFPLWPLLLSLVQSTLAGAVVANACFVASAVCFRKLSEKVLPNPALVRRATLIYCFNPASVFFSTNYSESLYALLAFAGLAALERRQLAASTALLTLATWTRANGILNAFFVFAIVMRHACEQKQIPGVSTLVVLAVMMACIASPYVAFQVHAYFKFCPDEPWCHNAIPSVYSHIQKHIWHNGFMAYWELKQIPNFLLASPVLLVSWRGAFLWAKEQIRHRSLRITLAGKLTPYVLHVGALASLAFFCFNVQISTRLLVSGSPALIWMLASADDAPVCLYCISYIIVGAMLHANFLPWT
eukprot:GEMP01048347.1.p1 GENE.GEMP01048347.1~~GEMP01048347.1.p1  ORF type:complete len:385 (+),score=83.35 GEMP01048347.1:105-1259(+)